MTPLLVGWSRGKQKQLGRSAVNQTTWLQQKLCWGPGRYRSALGVNEPATSPRSIGSSCRSAAFHSAAGFYATWAHEVIHSTGHPSRLKRDLSGRFGSRVYAREVLVAQLGSVLLGDQLEIGSALEKHAAYLGHWLDLLRETPQVLFQVLGEARRAVELVLPEAVGNDPG